MDFPFMYYAFEDQTNKLIIIKFYYLGARNKCIYSIFDLKDHCAIYVCKYMKKAFLRLRSENRYSSHPKSVVICQPLIL